MVAAAAAAGGRGLLAAAVALELNRLRHLRFPEVGRLAASAARGQARALALSAAAAAAGKLLGPHGARPREGAEATL